MKVPFVFPRVIAWEVTRRCPLKCRHCRAGAVDIPYAGELSTSECEKVLFSLAGERPPMIIWTGGEPMLREDILHLVDYASSLSIRSVMAPCGMFATEERLAELKAAGIMACSFSLDGPNAEIHDAFRGVPDAFRHITSAMAAAHKVELPFQVNTTLSRLNFHLLDDIYDLAVKSGASKFDVFFLVPVGRGSAIADLALSDEQTRQALDWCFKKSVEGPIPVKETCCPSAPTYWEKCGRPGSRPCGCLGGRSFAFLSHVGYLQTCGFIDRPCGNIRDFDFDFRAMVSAAANPLGACGNCRS